MAAAGGGFPPTPPKRPTIIRPGNNTDEGDVPIPARPAPPVPGARPPGRSPPGVPARPNANTSPRPPPPTPSRPDSRPKSQPPPKMSPLSTVSPASKSQENSGNGKKRPEITIVSARPMSEIGFRDSKPSTDSAPANTSENTLIEGLERPPQPTLPPQRSPILTPRVESSPINADTVINDDNSVTSRGPPPPVPLAPRPSVRPSRPSLSPRAGPAESSELPSDSQLQAHPSPVLIHSTTDGSLMSEVSPPMPRGAPPPVPRNPSLAQRPLPKVPPHSNKPDVNQDSLLESKTVADELSVDREKDGDKGGASESQVTDGMYAVINKPKRPTIIRPGRPSVKTEPEVKNVTEEIKKPSASPRLIKNEIEEVNKEFSSNLVANRKSSFEGAGNADENIPEFLKKKLKSTVDDSVGDRKADNEGGEASQPQSRGPPPPMKPKPSVKPKPALAAKPSVAIKPGLPQDSAATSADPEKEQKSVTSEGVKKVETGGEQSSGDKNVSSAKPVGFKRPTIIRPGRPAQSTSSENMSQVSSKETSINQSNVAVSTHDDDATIRLRPQPPLPSKRPVSMTNIPQALAQEQTASTNFPASKSLNLHSSAENVSVATQPKPNPRPAPRGRPASMMVPSTERPPLPSSGPKAGSGSPKLGSSSHNHSNVPMRPPQRPSQRSPSTASSIHDEKEDKSERPGHKGVPGVPVLPMVEKHSVGDGDDSGPAKPVRRPPPPKAVPKKDVDTDSSSSDGDSEFVIAQTKPDRPAGPPLRPSPLPDRRDTEAVELRPPRPGAVASPQKSSIKDEEEEHESVRMRPTRPESRPPRPSSIPGKIDQPSRPHPPRPSAPSAPVTKGDAPSLPARPAPGHPLYHYMMQVPHGIATHDYTARDQDELTFRADDVIVLARGVDADWVVGRLGDNEGMFPRGFIHVKRPLPGEEHLHIEQESSDESGAETFFDTSREKPDHLGHGPRCRARFDFEGEGADDLTFEDGDMIRLLERVGDEWRRGECDGRVGIFPLTYVEMIEDLPDHESETKTSAGAGNTTVTALFDFEGQAGELDFQKGESIHVLYQVNDDWLFGEIHGRKGQFPNQFVDRIPSNLPPLPDSQNSAELYTLPGETTSDKAVDHLTGAVWDDPSQHKEQQLSPQPPPVLEEPYCIAVYDYPGDSPEDLMFNAGDQIILLERISSDWLKGELGGNTGLFPASFVEVKVEVSASSSSVASSPGQTSSDHSGIVLHDFTGEADNELTFIAGDKVIIQEEVEGADGWSWGVLDGRRGIFPTAFISVDE